MRTRCAIGLLLLAAMLPGCGDDPPPDETPPATLAECRDQARSAAAETVAARAAGDQSRAARAAERAGRIADRARELLKQSPQSPGDQALADETFASVDAAGRTARLAAEDARLAELLSSWKARGYRAGRGVAAKAMFKALALAADQMTRPGAEDIDPRIRDAAGVAADLAEAINGRPRLPDGRCDWAGIAADMNQLSDNPPARLSWMLSAGLLLSGRSELALFEIEQADAAAVEPGQPQAIYWTVRSLACSFNDLPLLAGEHLERAAAETGESADSARLLAAIHLLVAVESLQAGKLSEADANLSRAIRLCPNHPAVVYLTGERLLAGGQREQAAESMQAAAAGTSNEALAQRLAARAKAIRDGQPGQTGLLRELVIALAAERAGANDWDRRLRATMESLIRLGKRLTAHLPG